MAAARSMTERLNAGRRRAREEWEKRQALNAGKQVGAQTGCSLPGLAGTYGYAHTGDLVDKNGDFYFFAAAGALTADGNGSFTGTDSTSIDGQVTRNRRYTGTYTVTPGCTGSM